MKKVFAYSILAILVLAGCQVKELEVETTNELDVLPVLESKPFVAIIEDDSVGNETRTTLDNSGNVLWKQGDQVSIFAGSTVNECYQVTDESEGKTSAALNKISGSGSGSALDNNVAFYPYASTAIVAKSGSSYVISEIELPVTQDYVTGSFGDGTFPMTAVTTAIDDMNLKFKNVLGGLKLQLKGTATISSISITGNNNEILCGDATVTVSDGSEPSISLTNASAKTVTLDCGTGVVLDAETAIPFIIALPPITMIGGFTVVITDTEGKQMEISTSKSQTISRSTLLKMPAVNYKGETTHDYLAEPMTFTSIGSTTITISKYGSPNNITLEYRIGNDDWTPYTIGTGINLLAGESLQFRSGVDGNVTFGNSSSKYYYCSIEGTGTVEVSGNIMSLIDRSLLRDDVPERCFYRMFYSCSKLATAKNLKLPATALASYCYSEMFAGCTSLIDAPELPATTLADHCYTGMFRACTGLITAPELPATTLATACYYEMFYRCSGMIATPVLPAVTLASNCYWSMFKECISLTCTPELPATILAEGCYSEMFYNCTGLTSAQDLLATTLAAACYDGMFLGCTSLTSAPALPATTLTSGCYRWMFAGCTRLATAPELPATTIADQCYAHMFAGCTSLTSTPELPASTLARECYLQMFESCTSLTSTPELPATTLADQCYYGMFVRCTGLTSAPELPATSLASLCYHQMFYGCTGLASAPELPATTLAYRCYEGMFYGCTGLATVPELPATTLASECCYQMFYGCTGLATAPELPATTLEYKCYCQMFYGCTGLETPPELPATTLASQCYYQMFYGCTGLASAPELPATTLANQCYYQMFYGCTSLTSAPELLAMTLIKQCYYGMFDGCSNLSYIKMLATDISASNCLASWIRNVSTTGTFVKNKDATWDNSKAVPSGWTVLTE